MFKTLFFTCLLLLPGELFAGRPAQSGILVDQFGYPVDGRKIAVLKVPVEGADAGTWQDEPGDTLLVRDLKSDEVVFRDAIIPWNNGDMHKQSGDKVWHFDFSEVTAPGYYRIEDPVSERKSHPFEIRENPWKNVLRAAMRTYFYQRSGHEKRPEYAGENWADEAAYLQEKQTRNYFDSGNRDRWRDLHGGWFDAGDYNKYITFTSNAVHPLLAAYRTSPDIWTDDYNIPESGSGRPDILDELKWQMDWVLRMQVESGGVIIKMGAREYYSASPPSIDNRNRYYGRVSTSSTIAFASMVVHAALVYHEFPEWEDYADTLIQAGRDAYDYFLDYYETYGELNTNSDRGEIKAGDADRSVESQRAEEMLYGIYMFALTGEEKWNDLVAERYVDVPLMSWWGPYNNYFGEGMLYYTTLEQADETVCSQILQRFATAPDPFYGDRVSVDPYFAAVPDAQYHWGSLSVLANTAILNLNYARYIEGSNPEPYLQRARDILHYIHGRNPLDKCYLSNMYAYGAENPVNEFYHGWFEHGTPWQNVLFSEKGGPPPGYLVGGPNQAFTGDENPYLPLNQPPQKMYTDFNDTGTWPIQYKPWEITENSISYQGAYVRLLSEFVSLSSDTVRYTAEVPEPTNSNNDNVSGAIAETFKLYQNYPNPFNATTRIRYDLARPERVVISIHDVLGQIVATVTDEVKQTGSHTADFDAARFSSGIYVYRIRAGEFTGSRKMILIK